jgi:hypothetical protein
VPGFRCEERSLGRETSVLHQDRTGRAHRTNLGLSLAGAVHILLGLADSNDWRARKAGSLTDLKVATGSSYYYDAKT